MCLCTNFYTTGTVYSSVESKAVTSEREVDKQLGLNNNALFYV